MDAKPVQRRLAAVLAADVAGYTRMVQIKPIDPERQLGWGFDRVSEWI